MNGEYGAFLLGYWHSGLVGVGGIGLEVSGIAVD